MSKVLYIKANPKSDEESRTFRISESFIKEYKLHNPSDEIITLDLYKEGINFLDADSVKSHISSGNDHDHPILKYAYQFKEADKFVIAEPLWNLGVPAILKAYLDYVCVSGITFKYTEEGAVGLCHGKAINITTRGGSYSKPPFSDFEMGDRYLRTIMSFLGITEYTTVAAEMLDVVGFDKEAEINRAIEQAKELAKSF